MESNILPLEAVSWWYAVTAVLATAIHADGRRLVRLFGRRSGKPQILKDYNGRLQLSDLRCGMAAWMAVTSTATTTGKRIGNAMSGRRRHRQSDPLGFFARACQLTMSAAPHQFHQTPPSFPGLLSADRNRHAQVVRVRLLPLRSGANSRPTASSALLSPPPPSGRQPASLPPCRARVFWTPTFGGQPVAGQSRYEPVSEVSADGEAASKCRRRLARATFQTYWRPG